MRKVLIGCISDNATASKKIYETGLNETMFPLVAVAQKIKPDIIYVLTTKEA